MKTELLSTVSHELRTPLGSIKGYATTLLTHGNKLKRDEQREFLEIIDSEADRLRELIENLLDLSRLEAGVLRIDKEPARLGGSRARSDAQGPARRRPTTTLQLDWPADDPLVNADAKRIYQVVQNLLTNAVKYSPDGGCIRPVGARASAASWSSRWPTRALECPLQSSIESSIGSTACMARCRA